MSSENGAKHHGFEVKPSVTVVIPTFAPSDALLELVSDLSGQAEVSRIIISDDASPVTADPVLRTVAQLAGVDVIRHNKNAGIARGLNDGLAAAVAAGDSTLLTLDQDSRIPPGYLPALLAELHSRESLWSNSAAIGVIAPAVVNDASGDMHYPSRDEDGVLVTEEVIQSGALWMVPAFQKVGGFDESLGIDAVDAAACLHLREAGYLVALAADVSLEHNLGDSRQVNILGRSVMITNHSPARRATMVRNRLRLAPAEFKQSPKHAFRTLRRVGVNSALGVLTGDDRWAKAKGSLSGLRASKDDPK